MTKTKPVKMEPQNAGKHAIKQASKKVTPEERADKALDRQEMRARGCFDGQWKKQGKHT